tara:strand:+ start:322 stop:1221 length:900 start_codon:yes stop_codon:yes gene_type:complete
LTVALIDGDIIAYKAAFVSTDTFEDQEIFDPAAVKANVDLMVKEWSQLAKAGATIVCLSDDTHRYFRHDVYPDYKGNREDRERPKALSTAYDCLKEFYKTVQYEGLEADDVMGVLVGSTELTDPVMVSIDKDLMTVPGKLLNPNKMRRPARITKPAADRMMLIQALQGDRTDNYFGVEGIGPVKAEKIVNAHADIRSAWDAVVETFGDEEMALTMTRLARILRTDDFNEQKGEVRLWHPTNKDIWTNAKPKKKKSSSSTASKTKDGTSLRTRRRASLKTATKRMANRRRTTNVSPPSGP